MTDDKPLSKPIGTYTGSLGTQRPVYAVRRHELRNQMVPKAKRTVLQYLVMSLGRMVWINAPSGLTFNR